MRLKRVTPNFIRGLADRNNIDISKYDMEQLMMGYVAEMGEHNTKNPELDVVKTIADPLRITIAHLNELPDYYDRLKDMEEIIRQEIRNSLYEAKYIIEKGLTRKEALKVVRNKHNQDYRGFVYDPKTGIANII